MKRRIGTIKGKPIIKGGGTNTLADNEILVENTKILVRENGQLKELCNNEGNNSNSSSSRILPSDIISIKQFTYTMDSYGDSKPDKEYDISSLINYSEELGVFVISKTDYDEIKQRDSYSGEFYFYVEVKDTSVEYSTSSSSNMKVTTVTGDDWMPHKFYYRYVKQDYMIADFKNHYKEFYLMVL